MEGHWVSKEDALEVANIFKKEVIDYPWNETGQSCWVQEIWLVDGGPHYPGEWLVHVGRKQSEHEIYNSISDSAPNPAWLKSIKVSSGNTVLVEMVTGAWSSGHYWPVSQLFWVTP